MHWAVLVIVPDGVADAEGYVRELMEPHRRSPEQSRRFDYFTFGGRYEGLHGATRGRPGSVLKNLVSIAEFDREAPCHALLLPDGTWEPMTRFVDLVDDDPRRSKIGAERW
jgi:hypothetical protein